MNKKKPKNLHQSHPIDERLSRQALHIDKIDINQAARESHQVTRAEHKNAHASFSPRTTLSQPRHK